MDVHTASRHNSPADGHRTAQDRHRILFEHSAISLWEDDLSGVKLLIDELRQQGVVDLRDHLTDHPEVILDCAARARLIDVNPATLRLLQATSKRHLARNLSFMSSPESLAVFRDALLALVAGQPEFGGEGVLHTLQGKRIHVTLNVVIPPEYRHDWSYVVVSMSDITNRRNSEEALRQRSVELAARNDELDAFAHTVAHDLKNPLALVLGYADLCHMDLDRLPPEQIRNYLRHIVQHSQKMDNIVDELLLLSSVRKSEVPLVPLDMGAIVHEVLNRLAETVAEVQARVVLPEEWPLALGHGPWVEEVWVNYVSNGLKYGGTPPHLVLGCSRGTCRLEGQDLTAIPAGEQMIRFWVRDRGDGLKTEQQGSLFVPFAQLGKGRRRGHGLGLSIVRRIIEKLGGQVGVESRGLPGEGSLFWFTLPAVPPDQLDDPPQV